MLLVAVIAGGGAWFLTQDDDEDEGGGGNGGAGGVATTDSGSTLNDAGEGQQVDLQPALLTQEDVGGEFQPFDNSGSSEFGSGDWTAACQLVVDLLFAPPTADAQAQFQRRADAAVVGHRLDRLTDDDPSIDEIQDAVAQCPSVSDQTTDANLTSTPIDGYGDSAVAIITTIFATTPDGRIETIGAYTLVWTRENARSLLTVVAGGLELNELAQGLAATVDQRLAETLQG